MEPNEQQWNELLLRISKQFKVTANFEFILFIIGVNERGSGFQSYTKEEKMDLMNLGHFVLLEHQGITSRTGKDDGGWPQFEIVSAEEAKRINNEPFFKNAMIDYFRNI